MRFFILSISIFICQIARSQLLPSFGDSRTATTGWQFLKIAPDARSSALSESFIALVDDVSALYWNAAGLTQLDSHQVHVSVNYTDYASSTKMPFAGIVYRIDNNTLVGASIQYFDAGEMDVTTEFLPNGTGQTFKASNMAVGLSLAKELTDQFSFGLTAKYLREDLATVHNQNVTFDFGFQYDIGIANTRFAVGLTNFGFNTIPSGEIVVENLLDTMLITDFDEVGVPTIFRVGFAWDAVKTATNQLTAVGQLNHPTDNNETYSLGVEYGWKQLFFARSGYIFATDDVAFPTFGFGLKFKRYFGIVKIDYSFNYLNQFGAIHRIGFGLAVR